MTLHDETFAYLPPTEKQKGTMEFCREAARAYAKVLDSQLPDSADKIYILRLLRTVAMWANVAITRYPDGAPRPDDTPRETA